MIYLVKTEVRNGTFFKVGFTANLPQRLVPYITHNPNVELLETVKTYKKTKHNLETEIQEEIKSLGYDFKVKNGTVTEWFFIPKDKEKEFERLGLGQFKACQNRQIHKV